MTGEAEQPELDLAWIEARAEAMLSAMPAWLWDGSTLPVPIEEIVDSHFGLHVREVDDLSSAPGCPALTAGQTLSALLLTEQREIWVSASEARQWPPRRRFSIGHELGHWVLHRRGQDSLFCRRATVDEEPRADLTETARRREARPALPLLEEEANAFASALLMPRELLRHHYRETSGDFERLCVRFGASGKAMGRRLHAAIPRGS